LQAAKLDAALPALESGRISGRAAQTEFLYSRAEAVWKKALTENPRLAELRNIDRHELVGSFQTLEASRRLDCVKDIRARHLNQVPQGAQGSMGFIRGEIGKKKAHAPIRKLFTNAGAAVQRIKPVLMMSPISVAQFLPPTSIEFDLLLIDEASQVRPEDALGAIARAKQIVVVGDQKQLPPSSFFDRLSSSEEQEDEEENASDLLDDAAKVGDLESILTLCEARGLSTRMLEWHYRSRDPSLIRVSNREFYGDGLILPPSPLQHDPDYGLTFTHVHGVYDRGGKRDNRIEAEAVVKRVAEHAQRSPDLSLGVVTFSFTQRNLITELLEFNRRHDPVLDRFLREGRVEDAFVKNIENVQGDERDVILISVGYGPSIPGGKPTMSFGPVNNAGGERRLNVLFTRARARCEIFCSFDPGEMDLSKTRLEGPRVLKRFLDFAKTGVIENKVVTVADSDSPFEADIASEIRKLGYLVDHQVGTAGFLIDLGIRHPERPGTYILAVECDGATYHSALWARERDRLRQQVLEQLGWKFHRIWSTDWFYRRPAEMERLHGALEQAMRASESSLKISGVNNGFEAEPKSNSPNVSTEPVSLIEVRQHTMPPYQKASISLKTKQDPHEVAISSLARLVVMVVETEGPIHEEEVARRIAAAFGKEKAGARILKIAQQALRLAKQSAESPLLQDGQFWFTRAQAEDTPVRDRSRETIPTTKPSNISKLEVLRCLKIALEDNVGGSDQDIIRAAARLFGFKRVGAELQDRLESCLAEIKR
jgi:very-short-patch-repair endonuclease